MILLPDSWCWGAEMTGRLSETVLPMVVLLWAAASTPSVRLASMHDANKSRTSTLSHVGPMDSLHTPWPLGDAALP